MVDYAVFGHNILAQHFAQFSLGVGTMHAGSIDEHDVFSGHVREFGQNRRYHKVIRRRTRNVAKHDCDGILRSGELTQRFRSNWIAQCVA